MTAPVSKAQKAMDGALDHISERAAILDRARAALMDIGDAVYPFREAEGQTGDLARQVMHLADNAWEATS